MAKMYLKFNTAVIKEVLLDKNEVTFGRRSDNDVVIDHPTVSARHGKIVKEADHFVVEDLNSTNGTFINGRRIKSGKVKDRDQIGVAGHIFDFYDDDSVVIPLTPAVESKPRASLPPLSAAPVLAGNPQEDEVPVSEPVAPEAPAAPPPVSGTISIIAGGANGQTRIALKDPITYIGSKDTAAIKIKGGFLAPDLAGVITRRADGFILKPLKSGYIKVNGVALREQILLENGGAIGDGISNYGVCKNRLTSRHSHVNN